jgi:hypothetical protein
VPFPSIAFDAGKLPSLSACDDDAETLPARARSASSADTGEATPNAKARATTDATPARRENRGFFILCLLH